MTLTPEQIDELERKLADATPGPWKVESYYDSLAFETFWTVSCSDGKAEMKRENADLIAALRNAAHALIEAAKHFNDLDSALRVAEDQVIELRAELETERMRLAGCGVAAMGYFDGCAEEYKSASLSDVLRLRDEVERLRSEMAQAEFSTMIRFLKDKTP